MTKIRAKLTTLAYLDTRRRTRARSASDRVYTLIPLFIEEIILSLIPTYIDMSSL